MNYSFFNLYSEKTLRFPALARFTLATIAIVGIMAFGVGSGNAQSYHTIDTQLDLGSRGAQVTYLQRFLATDASVYPEGLVTGYFGPLTAKAVVNFQIGYGIPAVGRVGPMTRQALNNLISKSQVIDVTAPTVSGVATTTVGTSVRVAWNTSEDSRGKVFYSTSPLTMLEADRSKIEPFISGDVVSETSLNSVKSLPIPNLLPNRTYYYAIMAIDADNNVTVSGPGTFTTGN